MSLILEREIEKVKKMILTLSARVEESVHMAARAIARRDDKLARQIVRTDEEIDQTEVEVEEECLKILALHQPVAIDLRYLVAVLKINSDLERIGDLAVNIAQSALYLSRRARVDIPFDFPRMAEMAQEMVSQSLNALVNMDPELARCIERADQEVDAINREMYSLVEGAIREDTADVDSLIRLLAVSRDLERIGDHATNIAEDVIYMCEGQIVRHKDDGRPAPPGG